MKKLIIHIEYESDADSLAEQELCNRLDIALSQIREENEDFGWRYFNSLDDAAAWERGDKSIEEVGV